ncbi:MAG TPA: hypothetical protein VGF40_13510 [Thermoanaerobaculia bacterium]
MKRAALPLAFLSMALLAGCGVGDAGRWIVNTSLRSAYGCSLMISSDQSAEDAGDVAKRPEPLQVRDRSIVVAKDASEEAPPVLAVNRQPRDEAAVEIAEVPISRDLSSIRGKGTRSPRAFYRYARAIDAPRFHFHISRPETPERPITVCPSSNGYRG